MLATWVPLLTPATAACDTKCSQAPRKLVWKKNLGTVKLKLTIAGVDREFSVSPLHARCDLILVRGLGLLLSVKRADVTLNYACPQHHNAL